MITIWNTSIYIKLSRQNNIVWSISFAQQVNWLNNKSIDTEVDLVLLEIVISEHNTQGYLAPGVLVSCK